MKMFPHWIDDKSPSARPNASHNTEGNVEEEMSLISEIWPPQSDNMVGLLSERQYTPRTMERVCQYSPRMMEIETNSSDIQYNSYIVRTDYNSRIESLFRPITSPVNQVTPQYQPMDMGLQPDSDLIPNDLPSLLTDIPYDILDCTELTIPLDDNNTSYSTESHINVDTEVTHTSNSDITVPTTMEEPFGIEVPHTSTISTMINDESQSGSTDLCTEASICDIVPTKDSIDIGTSNSDFIVSAMPNNESQSCSTELGTSNTDLPISTIAKVEGQSCSTDFGVTSSAKQDVLTCSTDLAATLSAKLDGLTDLPDLMRDVGIAMSPCDNQTSERDQLDEDLRHVGVHVKNFKLHNYILGLGEFLNLPTPRSATPELLEETSSSSSSTTQQQIETTHETPTIQKKSPKKVRKRGVKKIPELDVKAKKGKRGRKPKQPEPPKKSELPKRPEPLRKIQPPKQPGGKNLSLLKEVYQPKVLSDDSDMELDYEEIPPPKRYRCRVEDVYTDSESEVDILALSDEDPVKADVFKLEDMEIDNEDNKKKRRNKINSEDRTYTHKEDKELRSKKKEQTRRYKKERDEKENQKKDKDCEKVRSKPKENHRLEVSNRQTKEAIDHKRVSSNNCIKTEIVKDKRSSPNLFKMERPNKQSTADKKVSDSYCKTETSKKQKKLDEVKTRNDKHSYQDKRPSRELNDQRPSPELNGQKKQNGIEINTNKRQSPQTNTQKAEELKNSDSNAMKKPLNTETIKDKHLSPDLINRLKENLKKRKSVALIDPMPSKKMKPNKTTPVKNEISAEAKRQMAIDRTMADISHDHTYYSTTQIVKHNREDEEEEEEEPEAELNYGMEQLLPRTSSVAKSNPVLPSIPSTSSDIKPVTTPKPVNQIELRNGVTMEVQKMQNGSGVEFLQLKSIKVSPKPANSEQKPKPMVSLLKSNNMTTQQKKKLGLEEYYKLRKVNNIPAATNQVPKPPQQETEPNKTSPKPSVTEYKQKISKLAEGVLSYKKSSKSRAPSLPDIDIMRQKEIAAISKSYPSTPVHRLSPKSPASPSQWRVPSPRPPRATASPRPTPSPRPVIKVSFGVNTVESYSIREYYEMFNLLENSAVPIDNSCLVVSIMDGVYKKVVDPSTETPDNGIHWENKTICYESSTEPKETRDAVVQTEYTCYSQANGWSSGYSSAYSSSYSSSTRCNSSSSRSNSPTITGRSRRRSRSRSRSEDRERLVESEERRVVYVGNLSPNTTREALKKRFETFGQISKVSVHHKRGDCFGFVTFRSREDAYQAKEHGNDDPKYPRVLLSFGGRRAFCKTTYSDLDDVHEYSSDYYAASDDVPFDYLLNDFKRYRSRKQQTP